MQAATPTGPLAGTRILELERSGLVKYCGKMLADLGADVIKVEPPGGEPGRFIPPFVADQPHVNRSLNFWNYNLNKKSVVLDMGSNAGGAQFRSLIQSADVILDGLGLGQLERFGYSWEAVHTANPATVLGRATPFGTDGPWAELKGSDLVHQALGGTMTMTGYDDLEGSDQYPIAPAGGQVAHLTSTFLAMGVLAALIHRESSLTGQLVEVSAHDALARSNEMGIPFWEFRREEVLRHTARHGNPKTETTRQMFRCRDGKFAMCLTLYMDNDQQFRALVDWMDGYGLADDLIAAPYRDGAHRADNMEHIVSTIEQFCGQLDSDEIFHGAQARKLPWTTVNGPWDLLADPHLKARGALASFFHTGLGREIQVPGAPFKLEKSPWQLHRPAPDLGEHSDEVLNSHDVCAPAGWGGDVK